MKTRAYDKSPFLPDFQLISKAVPIISGKWRLYTILVLGEQTLRFGQLSERLPGISEKVLASELKTLAGLGIIKRVVHAEVPSRVDYSLTETGRSILPLLRQIQKIGQLLT